MGKRKQELTELKEKLESLQSRYDTLQHFLVHSQKLLLQFAEERMEKTDEGARRAAEVEYVARSKSRGSMS